MTKRLLACILLASGCRHRAPAGAPGSPAGGSWHVGAQRCFPREAGEWRLVQVHTYDNPDGEDRSYAYARDGFLATFYLYPRYGEPFEDLTLPQTELARVMQVVPDATWERGGSIDAPQLPDPGDFVIGRQPLSSALGRGAGGTLAAVWDVDPWFFKMRLSWVPEDRPWEEALRELLPAVAAPCKAGSEPPRDFQRR